MRVRGIRGAVQLEQDSASEMLEQVSQLLTEMLKVNQVKNEDLISIILTATPDLKSEFPAAAARQIGLGAIPLLCSVEIDVKDALPRVIRVLIHAHSDRELTDIKHVYLGGASVLRKDLAQ
jgi:chorismate mutase